MKETRLLLIEDEESIARPLMKLMALRGYSLEWAKDGIEALEKLSSLPKPDCLLIDVMMPRMNGWEFRERQLMQDDSKNIPVIFLSADNQSEREAQRRGEVFVSKPIDLDELHEALQMRTK